MDEVEPFDPEQMVGRTGLQSPLPAALRRPSFKSGQLPIERRPPSRSLKGTFIKG